MFRLKYNELLTSAIVVSLLSATCLRADETAELELKMLVQSLVSKNEEPPAPMPKVPYKLPRNFDETENRRVIAARDVLMSRGVEAFPYLIDALDDSRYSYTVTFPHWAVNVHVREVCLALLREQVEVYKEFARPLNLQLDRPRWLPVPPNSGFPGFFWPDGAKNFMQKWWEPRKALTLNHLQREAVEWAVQFEQGRGFIDDAERELVLNWYRPLQNRLTSSNKPITVDISGAFVGEDNLKPEDVEYEKWFETWAAQWGVVTKTVDQTESDD